MKTPYELMKPLEGKCVLDPDCLDISGKYTVELLRVFEHRIIFEHPTKGRCSRRMDSLQSSHVWRLSHEPK